LRVDRDVTGQDGTVHLSETRYFLTSTQPENVTADQLLTNVRQHWHVENCVFFIKDRWWDEDRHWTRRPGLSEWLAKLTTAAVSVLRIFRKEAIPLRAFADHIQWSPRRGLEILGLA
jgi:predicted transposase YbfD/YdcC